MFVAKRRRMRTYLLSSLIVFGLAIGCEAATSTSISADDADAGPTKAERPSRAGGGSSDDTSSEDESTRDASSPDAPADAAPTACSHKTIEGSACASEGEVCRPTECTDACTVCTSLFCTSGKWERREPLPMPPSYCAEIACGSLVCGKGEFCVRTQRGSGITDFACAPLTNYCTVCTCALPAAGCANPPVACTLEPDSQKPIVDCQESS
jgi:hypothetical protein